MTTYTVQYHRQQRVTREIEAETEEEAMALMEGWSEKFDLGSKDDESDDPGEIDVLDSDAPKKPMPTAFDAHVLAVIRATPDTCRFPSPIDIQRSGATTPVATALMKTAKTQGLVEDKAWIYPLYNLVLGAVKRLQASGHLTWISKDGYTWIICSLRMSRAQPDWEVVEHPINACNIPSNWDEL